VRGVTRTTLSLVLRLGGDDPERLGPYRLKAVIGDGGMGRVYLGTSPGGRPVAVKVIGPGLANQPGYRERFAREARAAMAVSGLYTASVVDADTEGERPYLATEYVAAPSLAEAVGATGPLPPPAVLALCGGMAEALVAIHRAGLVHRDVKPHNILLAADGPVVIDFGIAVGGEASLTAAGMTVGTPGYIAPEVLHGRDPSPMSDVFSLACVLVFAARGTGPFGTGDPMAIAHRSANAEPDLTGVPDEVRALVAPMLHRDPARRPTPAQLLQHVSLSSSVVLHDGLWLPESVRTLLNTRKLEVQRALDGAWAAGGAAPTAPSGNGLGPATPGTPGTPPGYVAPGAQPGYAMRPPVPQTPPADFAHLHPAPVGGPKGTSRRFYALVGTGGALVMAGAVVAVLLLANGGGKPGPTTTGTGSTALDVADSTGGTNTSQDTSTATDTDATSTATGVLHYKPGTYPVNKDVSTDMLGNTVTLKSVTVNADGTVAANLSYTDGYPGDWTCSTAKAGEATLDTDGSADDASTSSDCTKNPSKTWYMSEGQSVDGAEYFAHAPAGDGDWTFSMNSAMSEFQGSVSGIKIPTH
jgi:hypothetical protein